jgi:hypothetical protein
MNETYNIIRYRDGIILLAGASEEEIDSVLPYYPNGVYEIERTSDGFTYQRTIRGGKVR